MSNIKHKLNKFNSCIYYSFNQKRKGKGEQMMEDNWKDDIEYYNSLVEIIKAEDLKRMVELKKNIKKLIKEYHS